jgi:hypothetical protein
MHITSKDVIGDQKTADELEVPVGAHVITSTVDGDGAVQLVSPDAKLHADVISIARTPSGGFEVKTAVFIKEPLPSVAEVPLTPDAQAAAYLASKGQDETEAEESVTKYGASRILAAKAKEDAAKHADLDKELEEDLAYSKKAPAEPETPPTPATPTGSVQ